MSAATIWVAGCSRGRPARRALVAASHPAGLLSGSEPVVAPGAYDALCAQLVEAAGFPAVYMTGFGAAASLLGRPDVGLLTQTEMVGNAQRIAAAVGVPVIATPIQAPLRAQRPPA